MKIVWVTVAIWAQRGNGRHSFPPWATSLKMSEHYQNNGQPKQEQKTEHAGPSKLPTRLSTSFNRPNKRVATS